MLFVVNVSIYFNIEIHQQELSREENLGIFVLFSSTSDELPPDCLTGATSTTTASLVGANTTTTVSLVGANTTTTASLVGATHQKSSSHQRMFVE